MAPYARVAANFAIDAPTGMYTVAVQPSIAAASATPCAWLPALAATTPLARSASVSRAILVYAPRILNEPVRCRFSHLRYAGPPTSRLSGRDDSIGVYRTTPSSNAAAASISATLIKSPTVTDVAPAWSTDSPVSAISASCQAAPELGAGQFCRPPRCADQLASNG